MAEFCPDCVRKIFEVDRKDEDYVLSDELCFCEECCEWKRVVICEKKSESLKLGKLLGLVNFLKNKKGG